MGRKGEKKGRGDILTGEKCERGRRLEQEDRIIRERFEGEYK